MAAPSSSTSMNAPSNAVSGGASTAGAASGGGLLAQVALWVRFLILSAAWSVSALVVSAVYLFHLVADWMLTPRARRCPRPGDVVLVTGASTGIGLSTALNLLQKGFVVFAGVRKDADSARLKQLGLIPINIDVTNPDQIQKALKRIDTYLQQHAGQTTFAALINNAGVCLPGPMEHQSEADLRQMIDTNVTGAVLVTKAFLPLIRRHMSRLIFTGSVSGYLPQPAVAMYTASKFAIRGLALSLAEELRPLGISVSVIEPAQTATPIFDKAQASLDQLECAPEYQGLNQLVEMYNKILVRMVAAQPAKSTDYAMYAALTSKYPRLQYRTSWTASMHHWMSMFPAEVSFGKLATYGYRALYGMTEAWKC